MKYVCIVVAAMLVLLAAPVKAQSAPGSGSPGQVSATWHRGGGGQGSGHGDNGWQGRGNGGQRGDRGNGDRGRGWNRDDRHGRGQDGHWVWVKTRRPVRRFHWAFGHMRWFWEWLSESHREWRSWN